MKLKEKIRTESHTPKADEKIMSAPLMIALSVFFGYLSAGTSIGNGAPLCTAIAASAPLLGGISAFVGAMAHFFSTGFSAYMTEIISMPAVILARRAISAIRGRQPSPAGSAVLAFAGYAICGTAAAFFCDVTPALIAAIIFRGAISGSSAYFTCKAFEHMKQRQGITEESILSIVVAYGLAVCMLGGIGIGTVNIGRVCGMLAAALAGYHYGVAGGGAAGAVSVFALGVTMPSMWQTAAAAVCSSIACGLASKRGRLVSAAVLAGTAFAGSLIYGMPSDSPKFMTDIVIAAAIFCIVPDRFFRKTFSAPFTTPSAALKSCGNRLKFAASALSDVKTSFSKAAEVFDRREQNHDIASEVCGKVCSLCRSSAFCGESEEQRTRTYFVPAEKIIASKGYITENDLPKGLEHCTKKNMITEEFNNLYRLSMLEQRWGNITGCMKEITVEQLSGTEDMLNFFGRGTDFMPCCDEKLSEYVREAMENFGIKAVSAAVFSDKDGHVYAECFYEGIMRVKPEEAAEKIGEICERDFGTPEIISLNGVTRLCFSELPVFEAELGRAAVNGRETTSGDSDAAFRDGLGNIYVLISDGMGSGVRAAVESCMAVSLAVRIIRAGLGVNAAIRMINLLLLTKSADESFATIDLLRVNLFSGKAEIIKLGAAQSFVKSGGTVKTVESWSTPVGIVSSVEISKRNIQLSDGDQIVMITDGIPEEIFPIIRELMLSMGVTSQECAERIIGSAEKYTNAENYHKDDKTVCVVKLHKI